MECFGGRGRPGVRGGGVERQIERGTMGGRSWVEDVGGAGWRMWEGLGGGCGKSLMQGVWEELGE